MMFATVVTNKWLLLCILRGHNNLWCDIMYLTLAQYFGGDIMYLTLAQYFWWVLVSCILRGHNISSGGIVDLTFA